MVTCQAMARYAAMTSTSEPLALPTAELLLDVRTPTELALSPDGASIAFALHATVADEGSFVPSDLWSWPTQAARAPSR